MEGLVNFCPVLDYIREFSEPDAFLLVDIGCSGGIDRQWRRLGRRLRALGIDPNVREIERLRARAPVDVIRAKIEPQLKP